MKNVLNQAPTAPAAAWLARVATMMPAMMGLQVVVLYGIVWVMTGTLNLAFLIAAVAMIMRFAEPMAMFISYTSVVELIASALQRIASGP